MPTDKGSAASTAAKLEEVLKAVWDAEAKVDNKFSEMKWEMESADDWLVKKSCKPTFKKRDQEKQYLFNKQVRDKVNTTTSALQQTPPAIKKAPYPAPRINLQQNNILIVDILIADRSEHGWATVANTEAVNMTYTWSANLNDHQGQNILTKAGFAITSGNRTIYRHN